MATKDISDLQVVQAYAEMARQMDAAGLTVQQRYAVSHFRLGALKGRIDAETLARIDSWLFAAGGTFPLAPSVFLKVGAPAGGVRTDVTTIAHLLRCPVCSAEPLEQRAEDRVACVQCDSAFARREGVWDMKEAVA